MYQLPSWILKACGVSSLASILVSSLAIYLQLSNYRKPFEQRLIVRILLIVPMFATTCYISLVNFKIGEFVEPVREVYEAFVIYTFYKLLVLMLGGERQIIQSCIDRPPTPHPFPTSLILHPVNISDPSDFLMIKRCILQYVWAKPLLYLIILLSSITGYYDVNDISWISVYVWLGIIYNLSVTISLYNLAMFWKCLYGDLKKSNPWGKFLCVKLIIFASYWQGLAIGTLNWLGVFKDKDGGIEVDENGTNLGLQIQNSLLCGEMIFFAILHWVSFPYFDFTNDKLPDSARLKTLTAFKDWLCVGDLIYDLKMTTLYGDTYNFRRFDSISDNQIYSKSSTFDQKIYNGLRYSSDGRKYWLPDPNDYGNKNKHKRVGSSGSTSSIYRQNLLSSSPDQSTPLLSSPAASKQHRVSYVGDVEVDDNVGLLTSSNSSSMEPLDSDSNDQVLVSFMGDSTGNEDYLKDERLYRFAKRRFITDNKLNYPIEYDYKSIIYSNKIFKMRQQIDIERQFNRVSSSLDSKKKQSLPNSKKVKASSKHNNDKKSRNKLRSITPIDEVNEV